MVMASHFGLESQWKPLPFWILARQEHAQERCLDALDRQAVTNNISGCVHDLVERPPFVGVEVVSKDVVVPKGRDVVLQGMQPISWPQAVCGIPEDRQIWRPQSNLLQLQQRETGDSALLQASWQQHSATPPAGSCAHRFTGARMHEHLISNCVALRLQSQLR